MTGGGSHAFDTSFPTCESHPIFAQRLRKDHSSHSRTNPFSASRLTPHAMAGLKCSLKRVVNRDCKETRQSCHADRQKGQHRLQAAMDAAICGGVSFHEGRGMCQNAAHTASQFGKDDHLSYVSVTYTETVEKVYHLLCPSRKPMRFPVSRHQHLGGGYLRSPIQRGGDAV